MGVQVPAHKKEHHSKQFKKLKSAEKCVMDYLAGKGLSRAPPHGGVVSAPPLPWMLALESALSGFRQGEIGSGSVFQD